MIRYALARYVDDLTRNEPVNVGVIAYDGSRALARFDGEDANGRIDLRRVRHRITGSHSYRAWVQYWRRALEEPAAISAALKDASAGDPLTIEYLLSLGGDEFALQSGGEIVFDADQRDLSQTLDALYERLVRAEEPASPPSLQEKSRRALAGAGVPLDDVNRFRERAPISLDVAGQKLDEEVSYAVLNGAWHYMQEAPFDPRSVRVSRKEASHVAFLFEHAHLDSSGIVLYDSTDVVDATRPLLGAIDRFALTVDVAEPSEAAPLLHDALAL